MLFQQRDSVSPQSGQYSLNLNTTQVGFDAVHSSAFSQEPYTARPDVLRGWVRYDIAGSDSAFVAAHHTRQGVTAGYGFRSFHQGESRNWIPVTIPIQYSGTTVPDSLTLLFWIEPVEDTSSGAGFFIPSQIGFDQFQLLSTAIPQLTVPDVALCPPILPMGGYSSAG